ncbi:hypothetical protein [Streptosporangium sp. 'caverna']|uniref:hypothetical protein n=1 Tax=Streptosporangium sp. 'caverna' TaxID=2202249 RepID=UPI000D7E1678|nr:hypothetical protein [Streptosporangium sp. 'caverna']AWS43065.1 hypothetical protein DKM19_18495 [Streptosporangium sp. 'caverna']
MRSPLFVMAAAALATALALPAVADTTGDTIVTFTITAGALAITVPPTANLGSAAAGAASISGQLGPVTVTDARGALVASWTVTVSSTSFTTGGATPAETIPNSAVNYSAGLPTSTTGLGVFTPGLPGSLASPRTAFSLAAGIGNNSATWNPTITVNLPAAVVTGVYTGTITHSVA